MLKTVLKLLLCRANLIQQWHVGWTWGGLFYIYCGLKRQQNIFCRNFRSMFGICPDILPYFLSREFPESVVRGPGLNCFTCVVSYRFCSFYFCLFSSCGCFFCLFCTYSLAACVLVIVGFNSKQKMSAARFSFASLPCIKFWRLDVDSINYKKLAFGFNLDNSFASDTEHNWMTHSF